MHTQKHAFWAGERKGTHYIAWHSIAEGGQVGTTLFWNQSRTDLEFTHLKSYQFLK
jgi:hypothetical protein